MANGTPTAPGLSLSRETFAQLTPGPYLHAHLKHPNQIRPNGRRPEEWREPTINTGSLTHSNGSAVVRVGDTAIVCGVRAEILLASDVPRPPADDVAEEDLIEDSGLLVPNVELSTGCSPAHLPGNPPGTLAQSLSYRVLSLLHTAKILRPDDLRIAYNEPNTDEDVPDVGPNTVVKAYWTLYIDILCIALDGDAFDTAWLAVMAALRNTVIPKAWWDPDREIVLCSPLATDSYGLRLNDIPIAATFCVFTTASPLKKRDAAEDWLLADPDTFENDLCDETLTVVVVTNQDGASGLIRLEKSGGTMIDKALLSRCSRMAEKKRVEWVNALNAA